MPEFSVILQTKILRQGTEQKLVRAINSVLGQKMKCTFELIVICDNCQRSFDIVKKEFAQEFTGKNQRLRLFLLTDSDSTRNNHWRASARNEGIRQAKGFWIMYIDNDDYFTNNYLKQLCNLDPSHDVYFVNDYVFNKDWKVRHFNLSMGHCGTSNIIHKREMISRWPSVASYGREDWRFINNLVSETKNYKHIDVTGYCVAHIPGKYDI